MDSLRHVHAQYSLAVELALERAQLRLKQDWAKIKSGHESSAQLQQAVRSTFKGIVYAQGLALAQGTAEMVEAVRLGHAELRFLPLPEVVGPAEPSVIEAALDEAFRGWAEQDELPESLSQLLTTMVLQPARETVLIAVAHARTGFVLVPNTGACEGCLMKTSVGARQWSTCDGVAFHRGCRCWVAEVIPGVRESVPEITREVMDIAGRLGLKAGDGDLGSWRSVRRDTYRRLSDFRTFPRVPGVEIPELCLGHCRSTTGELLPQPKIDNVFGHVLYGWRNDMPLLEMRKYERWGHTADTLIPLGQTSLFPESWDDQDIIDSIIAGLVDTGAWQVWPAGEILKRTRVVKIFEYGGLSLRLQYYIGRDGGGENLTAFPNVR